MSTICAISTAPGTGGIGIIRLSGEDSFKVVEKIFRPKSNSEIKGYSIKYGKNLSTKLAAFGIFAAALAFLTYSLYTQSKNNENQY